MPLNRRCARRHRASADALPKVGVRQRNILSRLPLHDIGTAERFLATTKMSFEFKGAIVARDLILARGGPEDQADSVCEAIVRHQDIFVKGFAPIRFPLPVTTSTDTV
jgi:hypothetical protein